MILRKVWHSKHRPSFPSKVRTNLPPCATAGRADFGLRAWYVDDGRRLNTRYIYATSAARFRSDGWYHHVIPWLLSTYLDFELDTTVF